MFGRKGAMALSTFALAVSLSLGTLTVNAAACKGLEENACQRNGSCSWVKPYQRKDGVKVGGHCKSKPSKSSKSGGKK